MTTAKDKAATPSFWHRKTLTGMTLEDAYSKMDAKLDAKAYKPVKIGGQNFTDIKPPYVYEMMTDIFGPLGIGWGFETTEQTYVGSRTYKSSSNREVTEHYATAAVVPWYRLADSDERFSWGPVPGGAKNSERNYAESGAVTNALGKALSFLGAQRHIYKDADPTAPPVDADDDPPAYLEFMETAEQLIADARKNKTVEALKKATDGASGVKSLAAQLAAMSEAERTAVAAAAAGSVESVTPDDENEIPF